MTTNGPSPTGFLEDLVRRADRVGASDVHLHRRGAAVAIAFRLDGLLAQACEIPADLGERVFGRIKYLAKLKTYQESLPQEGRIDRGELGCRAEVRVSTYPTVTGEKVVLRLFQDTAVPDLEDLGFPETVMEPLRGCLARAAGLILLTGPAGSGKSTTIYACLKRLGKDGTRHIITVEDPVERILPGIMQTEVNEVAGLTFARAARQLLRQDPQVLVIGEARDEETVEVLVRAALTGHLAIATLHAASCEGVFERLHVLCREKEAMSSAVELVVNQRLLRTRCRSCAGAGCSECVQTGYRGRVAVAECIRVTPELRQALRREGPVAARPGTSLRQLAAGLVESGVTTEAEIRRVLSE
jgi:general secretion pathway protein E